MTDARRIEMEDWTNKKGERFKFACWPSGEPTKALLLIHHGLVRTHDHIPLGRHPRQYSLRSVFLSGQPESFSRAFPQVVRPDV